MRVALVSLYDDRCYGLRCIASFLRQQGHDVWLLCFKRFLNLLVPDEDREAWRRMLSGSYPPVVEAHEEGTVFCPYLHPITEREWELFFQTLGALRPELIGMTVTTATFDASCEATERIHREMPGLPVVWGGVHATICPEQSLQSADMVCVGEGEHTLAELCADPKRGEIAGLWRKRNGEIIPAPRRPLEQELDRFPFPSYGENEWFIDDDQAVQVGPSNKEYFRAVYTMQTGRGCPFSCSYCCHHLLRAMHRGERYLRRRSVDHVLEECARRAREFELTGFGFYDDIFVIGRRWVAEFAEKYPRRVGLPFGGFAYPLVSTEEMLRQLADAGMIFIGLGIQTGSDYIGREVYNRRYGSEHLVRLARMVDRLGLSLNYELLTNCPYESENDCMETLRLLTRMPRPYSLVIKKIVFFPRTRINSIEKPKHNLPEKTFAFWNQLYLIARHHLIAPERLFEMARDEYLKANPEIVRAIALALKKAVENEKAARQEVERLIAEQTQVTLRGLLRYAKRLVAKWLPEPVKSALRPLRRLFQPLLTHR